MYCGLYGRYLEFVAILGSNTEMYVNPRLKANCLDKWLNCSSVDVNMNSTVQYCTIVSVMELLCLPSVQFNYSPRCRCTARKSCEEIIDIGGVEWRRMKAFLWEEREIVLASMGRADLPEGNG